MSRGSSVRVRVKELIRIVIYTKNIRLRIKARFRVKVRVKFLKKECFIG
jgi:hypothetical protein